MSRNLLSSLLLSLPLAALSGLLCAAPALAADHEISYETSTLGVHDPSWQTFDEHHDFFGANGLRVGYAVHDRVAIVGGWHLGRNGQDVFVDGEDQQSFRAAFTGHEFLLGAKADLPLARWFRPYALLQAMGVYGVVRLDEDVSTEDNLNQIKEGAFAPGGVAAGGFDIRVPFKEEAYIIATYFEFGYGQILPLRFQDMGDITMGGFAFRWGVGARF